MKKQCNQQKDSAVDKQCDPHMDSVMDKLLGLGENSIHKSYYPALQDKIQVLKETENNLRLIFDNSYDAIVIYNLNGNILDVNETMLKLFGYIKETALEKNIEDIILLDIQNQSFINYWRKAVKGERVVFEWQAKKRISEELFPIDIALCSIKWNGSDAVMANIMDITEKVSQRKAIEDAMLQLETINTRLESLVDERTRQLKNTQMELIQREKMASIGLLAAGIAHEVNNPLGYVISNAATFDKYSKIYIDLLSQYRKLCEISFENPPEEYIRLSEAIHNYEKKSKIDYINEDIKILIEESGAGLNRIANIVRGLKDFARLDQLQEFEDYDLNQGIEKTLLIANNSIKYHAKLELELKEIPILQAFGNEINQTILNLLLNSVHAIQSAKREGIIRIKTYRASDYVVLEIEDNGIGISEENLLKIFDPFFTTKPIGEGTGLGLSIAYDIIVNKHKGKIDVKSEVGKGTTFIVQLPVYS